MPCPHAHGVGRGGKAISARMRRNKAERRKTGVMPPCFSDQMATMSRISTRRPMMITVVEIVTVDWPPARTSLDRKSTRLNSSHSQISYAVFCLKKKIKDKKQYQNCQSVAREVTRGDTSISELD